MITFLWMLYLAFSLFLTYVFGKTQLPFTPRDNDDKWFIPLLLSIICILWSIWYFYFLH